MDSLTSLNSSRPTVALITPSKTPVTSSRSLSGSWFSSLITSVTMSCMWRDLKLSSTSSRSSLLPIASMSLGRKPTTRKMPSTTRLCSSSQPSSVSSAFSSFGVLGLGSGGVPLSLWPPPSFSCLSFLASVPSSVVSTFSSGVLALGSGGVPLSLSPLPVVSFCCDARMAERQVLARARSSWLAPSMRSSSTWWPVMAS
uniref:Uncharacterized protein n=1 Tax=Arundo donax TaxID=35708 RepID=A0A0A9DDG1_ARUDO